MRQKSQTAPLVTRGRKKKLPVALALLIRDFAPVLVPHELLDVLVVLRAARRDILRRGLLPVPFFLGLVRLPGAQDPRRCRDVLGHYSRTSRVRSGQVGFSDELLRVASACCKVLDKRSKK